MTKKGILKIGPIYYSISGPQKDEERALRLIHKWIEETKNIKSREIFIRDICCKNCNKVLMDGIDEILETVPGLEIRLCFNHPNAEYEIRESKILNLFDAE